MINKRMKFIFQVYKLNFNNISQMLLHNQNLHQSPTDQNLSSHSVEGLQKRKSQQQRQNQNQSYIQWKDECISLQKLLKQQHSLLWTQNQQKISFQKKLSQSISAYYKSKIQSLTTKKNPFTKAKSKQNKIVSKLKQTFEIGDSNKNMDSKKNGGMIKQSQQKILLEDQGFGDSCLYIKEILLSLSKDPQLMLTIIRKHQSIGYSQNLQSVVKSIVHSMYGNIVDDDIYNKDLFFIINQAFKLLVASAKNYTDIKLKQDKSIAGLIVKEFLKKTQILNYSKQLIKNMVLQIYKIDHQVSFNSDQSQKSDKNSKQSNASLGNLKLKKLETMKNQGPVRDQKINPKSKIQNSNSKITQYSEALQVKDEKMKLNRSHSHQQRQKILRNKNKKCMSKQLLKYMGITEQIQFPTFVSSTANNEFKKQEEINKQWAAMLNQKESQSQINPDIILIKNIVLIFFSDLFKMLYTLPLSLRIACKMFYEHLEKKFGSKKGCFYVIAEYVLGLCVIKNLQVEQNPGQKSKVSNHVKNNLATFRSIIMNVIRNDFKNIPRSFEYEFNLIVSNLRISLFNYMTEIINIDSSRISHIMSGQIQNKQFLPSSQAQKIKSYSVCVSISDIKKLFEMIKLCKSQLMNVNKNDKLVKRIERIQMITEGADIFRQREDKRTRLIYRPQNAYVMFYELQLPKQLNANFIKYHENYFKVDKFKKMMKSFLLSIKSLEYFPQFHKQSTLFGFLNQLSQKPKSYYQISTMIENIDHIPIQVKIKYLVSLIKNTYSQNEYGSKLFELVSVMYKQVVQRMEYYKTIWDKSKQSYLKALSSVIYLNQIIINTENIIAKSIKNKKLDEFITKTKIAVCLTSPKTRQKDIVSKTNIIKDLAQDQKSKIWLQNQSRCIHTALNLQFIKSLTGQPDKMKKQDSHCNNIMKFTDVLCSLPEIKQNAAQDIGVKQTFFEFIKYCTQLVVKNEQYASFGQDIPWLQESFEQKLSKKIYDRLYPKDPSYEDVAFYLRLKTLDFITYSHLKIKVCLRNDKMWELAGRQLRMMDKVKTASEKLNCINQCSKIILNNYYLLNDSDKPASAEDIYPLVVYVLIKAAPKRMISNMTFIEYFASQSRLMSKQGYAFSQLKSAIQFCDLLTEDNIEFQNMTPAEKTVEFRKTIYEKEIQYGIYFLLLRKNTSHEVDSKNIKFLKDFFSNLSVQH